MISLIKAVFVAPIEALGKAYLAALEALGPFAFLLGIGLMLAGLLIVLQTARSDTEGKR